MLRRAGLLAGAGLVLALLLLTCSPTLLLGALVDLAQELLVGRGVGGADDDRPLTFAY